jgi:hypothetical protein
LESSDIFSVDSLSAFIGAPKSFIYEQTRARVGRGVPMPFYVLGGRRLIFYRWEIEAWLRSLPIPPRGRKVRRYIRQTSAKLAQRAR